MLAATFTLAISGCQKKETEIKTIEYSEEIGSAEGIVDFESEEEPEIDIKEIRSYKGENIDYSSGIDIKNVDKFEDFQMWVDSTEVDIYVPGKYIAVYRFVYNGKTIEEKVSVTIMEKEEEQKVSTYSSTTKPESNSQNSSEMTETTTQSANIAPEKDTQEPSASEGNQATSEEHTTPVPGTQSGNEQPTTTKSQTGNSQTATTKPQGGSNQTATTKKPQGGNSQTATTKPQSGNGQTTSREIITTKKTGSDKISTIGYTNIELLSGTYVKIKCTNAKYIVSTRTDTSKVEKNGVTYKVDKLVITFNTGAEQVLETVETALKK